MPPMGRLELGRGGEQGPEPPQVRTHAGDAARQGQAEGFKSRPTASQNTRGCWGQLRAPPCTPLRSKGLAPRALQQRQGPKTGRKRREEAGGWVLGTRQQGRGAPRAPPEPPRSPVAPARSWAAWLQAGRCGGAGKRQLRFRWLFSGAGEKPRSDEIVTKETRKQGPAPGTGGCGERGRKGRGFCQPQGRLRGLPGVGRQQLETERGHESSRVLNFNGNP